MEFEEQEPKVNKSAQLITKKVAALELFKVYRRIQNLSIMGIAGAFLVACVSVLSITGAALTAAIVSAGSSYFLVQARKNMVYFDTEYELGFTKR